MTLNGIDVFWIGMLSYLPDKFYNRNFREYDHKIGIQVRSASDTQNQPMLWSGCKMQENHCEEK